MKILVIEDEKEIADSLKKNLETECFIVDIINDGEEGLITATNNHYDLIILDNILPRKTGSEICKELRQKNITTPILIISVRSEIDMKIKLLNLGADDYITKPFVFNELLARVKALVRRPKEIEQEILTLGTLSVDTKKHKVTRNNKEIYLTKKEFMFLECLLKNVGRVMSRRMILERVWDINADPFSNTIESHIVNLRKKIDIKNEEKLIHTVTGRGYKIDTIK